MDTEVLIVGAGPVGLTCSILLSRLGVANRVLERREGLHTAPRAHVVSARSMEIFRAAGIDEASLREVSTPPADLQSVLWMHTLAGPELGRLSFVGREGVAKLLAATPAPLANIPQHRLEPVLLEEARRAGAEVSFGHEWQSLGRDAGGVTARGQTSQGEGFWVRSQYLLACDGAGSRLRNAVGIGMQGPARIQHFLMIHLAADFRALVRERPGILYWHLDPEEPGTFIAHDIDSVWVYMHPYDPDLRKREDFTPERCREIVGRALGADTDFEVRSVDTWTMTAQVAEHYSRGRVYLVGDAAHRFPPTGGIGMNTGIADAFNLAWKLAAVCDGRAGAALLDTYEEERRSIARANSEHSLRNARRMSEVTDALGLPAHLDRALARKHIRGVPDDGALAARVQSAIDAQREHFDVTGLDLGQRYERGALVQDGTPPPDPENPVMDYIATTRPGSRLPHAWVLRRGERVSTLDLVDRRELTLITGPRGEPWRGAGLPTVAIGPGCEVTDPNAGWLAIREISDQGAILVRPDGHVAWRSAGRGAVSASELAAAVAQILSIGRDEPR